MIRIMLDLRQYEALRQGRTITAAQGGKSVQISLSPGALKALRPADPPQAMEYYKKPKSKRDQR